MIKQIKSKFTGNKKNIAKISSGTLLGQIISIVILPIITRLYGAEIIGLYTLLNSYAMIIKSFSDLGLTNSIMIEGQENVERTYRVITTIVSVISLISSIVFTLYFAFNSNDINIVFIFIFLTFIFFTTQQIQLCYTWLNRDGQYNILMKNPIINNSIYGIVAILLGFCGFKTYGYFIGHMVGQAITLFHMKRNLPNTMFTFKITDYKKCFYNNKRFIFYQMPTNVIANFKNQLPILLIKSFWGNEMLGYYSITVRLLQIPSTLLATAIGRVFFHTTSTMKREGKEIGSYVYMILTTGMKIGIVPITLLMAFGDVIAVIFLGEDWKIAGDFVRILALQYFFIFLMNSVQGLSITLNKQNYAMISSLFQIIGFIFGASFGRYIFDNIYYGLALMSLFIILINIIYFASLFKVMKVQIKKYILSILLSIGSILLLSFAIRYTFDSLGIIEFLYRII